MLGNPTKTQLGMHQLMPREREKLEIKNRERRGGRDRKRGKNKGRGGKREGGKLRGKK